MHFIAEKDQETFLSEKISFEYLVILIACKTSEILVIFNPIPHGGGDGSNWPTAILILNNFLLVCAN